MANDVWSVWICAGCRRRVPEHVEECRCGALRAHALGVIRPEEGEEAGPRLWPRLVGALALGAALAGSWLWFVQAPAVVAPFGEQVMAPPPSTGAGAAPPVADVAPIAALPPVAPPAMADPAPPPAQFNFATAPPPSPAAAVRTGPAAPPGGSVVTEADRAREVGMQRLRAEFAALRANASTLIAMVRVYEDAACPGRNDEKCQRLLADIGSTAIAVGAGIERTEDIARTSWLEPGVVRDMRTQAGLDDAIWDKIERLTREYRQ